MHLCAKVWNYTFVNLLASFPKKTGNALFLQLSALFQQYLRLEIVSTLIHLRAKKCPPYSVSERFIPYFWDSTFILSTLVWFPIEGGIIFEKLYFLSSGLQTAIF